MPRDGSLPSKRSLRALDLLNFFMADVQTGFGPFVAVYLTSHKWTEVQIGLALSLGTLTSVASQLPAGALVDAMSNKRAVAAAAILCVMGAAVLLATAPITGPVYFAELLHGFASCLLVPAIAAISLRLVGHVALGERLGRNASFASIGNGLAAGILGGAGTYLGSASVFWLTAALGVPALLCLTRIQGSQALVAAPADKGFDWRGLAYLFTDKRLLAFGAAAFIFTLSNAAMLPIAATRVTEDMGDSANLVIAACIMVPQAVVAIASPYVGRTANTRGRRPLLLIGWGALPIRGLLLAALPGPYFLIAGQSISGISGAVFGVMLPLIAADLTRDRGHFNLCLGAFGLCVAAGGTLSTTMAGWISDQFSQPAAFLALSAAGLLGTLLVWLVMPETRELPPNSLGGAGAGKPQNPSRSTRLRSSLRARRTASAASRARLSDGFS